MIAKYNKKITTFNELRKKFSPYTISLVSGSFEPFNEYYFRFLGWASRQNRPIVVVVQKDQMVLMRRGFLPLSTTCETRAEIISSMEFIDYVVIADKTAHNKELIEQLRPKVIAFQNDYLAYRKTIAKEIKRFDPKIIIKIAPFRPKDLNGPTEQKFVVKTGSNKIARRLLYLAKQSKGKVSKISAILADNRDRILAEAANSMDEKHAEILLLQKARLKRVDFMQCYICVLIPPCLMCAREILRYNVKKVFYLLPYGDNRGIEYLKKNNIQVQKL